MPFGGLYATYHLLGEPETTIDITIWQFGILKNTSRWVPQIPSSSCFWYGNPGSLFVRVLIFETATSACYKTTNKSSSLMCNSRPCGDSQVTRHEKGSRWEKNILPGNWFIFQHPPKSWFSRLLGVLDFLLLIEEILHQLRLVVNPIFQKVLAPSQVVIAGFLPFLHCLQVWLHLDRWKWCLEPNRRWDDEKGGVPVSQRFYPCVSFGGFLPFHFFEVFNKKPTKTFPNKNHAKQFAIWNSWNNLDLIIIYNKFLQGAYYPQKVCSFQKEKLVFQPSFLRGYL